MLPRQSRQADHFIFALEQPHRDKQGQHHIDRPFLETERAADAFVVRRLLREPGEEVQVH